MSLGIRSGVNWIRAKSIAHTCAKERASRVLPSPGISLISTWPSASRANKTSSTASRLPMIASSTASATAVASSWTSTPSRGPSVTAAPAARSPLAGRSRRDPGRCGSRPTYGRDGRSPTARSPSSSCARRGAIAMSTPRRPRRAATIGTSSGRSDRSTPNSDCSLSRRTSTIWRSADGISSSRALAGACCLGAVGAANAVEAARAAASASAAASATVPP